MSKYKFEIKNLDVFYGNFQALKNVSMNIDENEITALLDRRLGKSTLLKALTE